MQKLEKQFHIHCAPGDVGRYCILPGDPGRVPAIAALFLGIASFFTIMSVFLPFLFGGLAILFALLSKGYGRKMLTQAKIGLICGIGGLCVTASLFVSSAALLLKNPDMLHNFFQ